MLEAVNSVLQTTPTLRGQAEKVSSADSFAANPDRVQKAVLAPYVSPYVHVDLDYGAVLQIRDRDTGDVVDQFPSRSRLEAEARAAVLREQAQSSATAISRPESAASAQARPTTPDASDSAVPPPPASFKQLAAFQAASQAGTAGSGTEVKVLA